MIREKIIQIIRDTFGDQNLRVDEKMTAADVDNWDSLTHIQLIMKIEKTLGVKFALGELHALKNVGDLFLAVERKLAPA